MYYLLLVLLRKTKLSNTSKTKNNNNRNKQTEAQAQRWGGWAPGASDKLSWLVGGRARRGRCPDGKGARPVRESTASLCRALRGDDVYPQRALSVEEATVSIFRTDLREKLPDPLTPT